MLPIHLNNYFSPYSPAIVAQILLIVITFEASGYLIANYLVKAPAWTRTAWWLLGLGFFSFCWFLVNIFVPLSYTPVLLLLLSIATISVPIYLKNKAYLSLYKSLTSNWFLILIFLPLVPLIYIKTSLPPYLTDEMAYQLLSPVDLLTSTKWQFSGGIYHIIPKTLNIIYSTTFALTRSYTPARLTHFLILFTSILTICTWLKLRFGRITSLAFWLLIFFTPQKIFYEAATSGYIDIATASIATLGVILNLDILLSKKLNLAPSLAFWALALSIKYTAITVFVANWITLSAIVLFKKSLRTQLGKVPWIKILLLFSVLGGFWYLKNLIFTGNPIYPFLFGCRPVECVGDQGLFSGWTIPVNFSNLHLIFNDIFFSNRKLEIFAVASVVVSLLSGIKSTKRINILLLILLGLELVLVHFIAGFYLRYFWHFQFVSFLVIAISLNPQIKQGPLIKILSTAFLVVVSAYLAINYSRTLKHSYAIDRLPRLQVDYALRRITPTDWATIFFPKMQSIVRWCDQNPGTQLTKLYRTDPDLIWSDYEGQSRAFMTNCIFADIGLYQESTLSASLQLRNQLSPGSYFISLADCQKPENIITLAHETPWQKYLRYANNEIVCSLPQISPHLYRVGDK